MDYHSISEFTSETMAAKVSFTFFERLSTICYDNTILWLKNNYGTHVYI